MVASDDGPIVRSPTTDVHPASGAVDVVIVIGPVHGTHAGAGERSVSESVCGKDGKTTRVEGASHTANVGQQSQCGDDSTEHGRNGQPAAQRPPLAPGGAPEQQC